MKIHVTQAFGFYKVGDQITNVDEIKKVLDSERIGYVVKVKADQVKKLKEFKSE